MTQGRMRAGSRPARTAIAFALVAAVGAGWAPSAAGQEAIFAPPYHSGFTYSHCLPQLDPAYAPASCTTGTREASHRSGAAAGSGRLESAGGGALASRARQSVGSVFLTQVNVPRGQRAQVIAHGILRSARIDWTSGGLSEGRLYATICVSRSSSGCADGSGGVSSSLQLLASTYGLPSGWTEAGAEPFAVAVAVDDATTSRGGKYWVQASVKANLQLGTCTTSTSGICVGDTGSVGASYDAVVDSIRVTTG